MPVLAKLLNTKMLLIIALPAQVVALPVLMTHTVLHVIPSTITMQLIPFAQVVSPIVLIVPAVH